MKTQITYHEENGYLYPDLALPEQTHYPIGKYGNGKGFVRGNE